MHILSGLLLILLFFAGIACSGERPASQKGAAQAEPITLSISDLYPGKAELLELARELKAESVVTRNSVEYVVRHKQFQRAVSLVKPPPSKWTEDEQQLIASVPEPTEDAWKRFTREQQKSEEEAENRAAEKERLFRREQRDLAREHARLEHLRQQRVAEAQRWEEIDALHRRADALENSVRPYYGPCIIKQGPFKLRPPSSAIPRRSSPPGPGILSW